MRTSDRRLALLVAIIATPSGFVPGRGKRRYGHGDGGQRRPFLLPCIGDDQSGGYSAMDLELERSQHHFG